MDPDIGGALKRMRRDPVFFARKVLKNTDFEPLEVEPQQAAFLLDNSTFRSLKWSRRSGKSNVIAVESIHKCLFNKGKNIFIVTADSAKIEEFVRELDGLIHRSDYIPSSVTVDNRQSKIFANQSRIKILTGGSKSGSQGTSAVGGSATDLYLDEIQDIDPDNVKIILPTVIGQLSPPKLVIAGTPRTRGDFTDELFNDHHQIIIDGKKVKKTNPEGAYSYHEFRICEVDEDDNIINIRSPRVTHESLRLLQRSMGPLHFRRELALEYVDSITAVYPEKLRNACGILGKPTTDNSNNLAVAGLDYGKQRNNSVLCIAEFNNSQKKWEASRFKSWPLGTEYKTVNHWVNTILPNRFRNIKFMLFDKTGIGEAASESLEMSKRPYKEGFTFSQPSKITLAENCVGMLENQKLTYYKHPQLDSEMKNYSRDLSPTNKLIYPSKPDDFVDAFNLAALAIHMYENGTSKYKQMLRFSGSNNLLLPRTLGINAFQSNNVDTILNNPYLNQEPKSLRAMRVDRRKGV